MHTLLTHQSGNALLKQHVNQIGLLESSIECLSAPESLCDESVRNTQQLIVTLLNMASSTRVSSCLDRLLALCLFQQSARMAVLFLQTAYSHLSHLPGLFPSIADYFLSLPDLDGIWNLDIQVLFTQLFQQANADQNSLDGLQALELPWKLLVQVSDPECQACITKQL